jgi:hypothetical protein
MGLEPTTFCMARSGGRSRRVAPVRRNLPFAATSTSASERQRTRANAECSHCSHRHHWHDVVGRRHDLGSDPLRAEERESTLHLPVSNDDRELRPLLAAGDRRRRLSYVGLFPLIGTGGGIGGLGRSKKRPGATACCTG